MRQVVFREPLVGAKRRRRAYEWITESERERIFLYRVAFDGAFPLQKEGMSVPVYKAVFTVKLGGNTDKLRPKRGLSVFFI